jgi:hypothetical protein
MLERLLDQVPLAHLFYTLVEINPACVEESRQRITEWAVRKGYEPTWESDGTLEVPTECGPRTISFICADVFEYIQACNRSSDWDAILAHAFMDLVDCRALLPNLCRQVAAGGLLYLSLNYDGETIFLPVLEDGFDQHIIELYHQSMDARVVKGRPAGDRYTGRHLLTHLTAAGGAILAAGSSDWVVFPQEQHYQADEAYFLHAILHTLEAELRHHTQLDRQRFAAWIAQRHRQVETGDLLYVAKNLDLLAMIGKPSIA